MSKKCIYSNIFILFFVLLHIKKTTVRRFGWVLMVCNFFAKGW